MVLSRAFALSLLLVSPLALARVQLNANVEIKNSSKQSYLGVSTEVQLDANASAEAYKGDELLIQVQLLAEKETEAVAQYIVSVKNEHGVFEKVAEPVLVPAYGKSAMMSLGNTEGDMFTITLDAKKI